MIDRDVLGDADPDQGREGMTCWQILVLDPAKAGGHLTCDDLQDLAEIHRSLRAMMQVGDWDDASFNWPAVRDNLCLLRPETVEPIHHLVVGKTVAWNRKLPKLLAAIRSLAKRTSTIGPNRV